MKLIIEKCRFLTENTNRKWLLSSATHGTLVTQIRQQIDDFHAMSQLMGVALSHPYTFSSVPKKCEPEFFFVWQTQFSVLLQLRIEQYNTLISARKLKIQIFNKIAKISSTFCKVLVTDVSSCHKEFHRQIASLKICICLVECIPTTKLKA